MIHHQMELYNLLILGVNELFLQFNKWIEQDFVHIAIPHSKDIRVTFVWKKVIQSYWKALIYLFSYSF